MGLVPPWVADVPSTALNPTIIMTAERISNWITVKCAPVKPIFALIVWTHSQQLPLADVQMSHLVLGIFINGQRHKPYPIDTASPNFRSAIPVEGNALSHTLNRTEKKQPGDIARRLMMI